MSVQNGKTDWRTQETHDRYIQTINGRGNDYGCPLCKVQSIKEYTYWRLIPNEFPYDKIASIHDMILPKRHITEENITHEEKEEFDYLMKNELGQYNVLLRALPNTQSVPNHVHYHLLVPKSTLP